MLSLSARFDENGYNPALRKEVIQAESKYRNNPYQEFDFNTSILWIRLLQLVIVKRHFIISTIHIAIAQLLIIIVIIKVR